MFGFGKSKKEEPEGFKPNDGENILSEINKPRILVHETKLQKTLRHLGNAASNTRVNSPRLPGAMSMTGAAIGGMHGGAVGSIVGAKMMGGGSRSMSSQRNTNTVQQQPEIPVDKIVITDKRLLAVINGNNITLEALYDKDWIARLITGQKKKNFQILENMLPPRDKGDKYSWKVAMQVKSLPLKKSGYVEEIGILAGIQIKKGLLGGISGFEIEIADISFPLMMNDNIGKWERLKSFNTADRPMTFSNELEEEVSTAKYEIKVKEDKKQHIDNEQIMLDFTQNVQTKIKEIREYALRQEDKTLFASPTLKENFES